MSKQDFVGAVALLTSVLLVIITMNVLADDDETFGDVLVSKVVRVYDGDTFFADIDAYPDIIGKEMGIRIRGIDTPEIRTRSENEKALAQRAQATADSILTKAKVVILHDVSQGKYFRIVADVTADGVNIADTLISLKLAVKYDGGTKTVDWDTVTINTEK